MYVCPCAAREQSPPPKISSLSCAHRCVPTTTIKMSSSDSEPLQNIHGQTPRHLKPVTCCGDNNGDMRYVEVS